MHYVLEVPLSNYSSSQASSLDMLMFEAYVRADEHIFESISIALVF